MKQEFYYMPNGLTSKIHNKILQNIQGCKGKMKNDPRKTLLNFFKEATQKIGKRLLPGSGETDCRFACENRKKRCLYKDPFFIFILKEYMVMIKNITFVNLEDTGRPKRMGHDTCKCMGGVLCVVIFTGMGATLLKYG